MSNQYDLNCHNNIKRASEDNEYLGELIYANEGLIWHILHKYLGDIEKYSKRAGVETEDLFQIATIGFMEAVEGYDSSKGKAFSTYAAPRIVGEVQDYYRKHGNIPTTTRYFSDAASSVYRYMDDHKENGYIPPDEIAANTGLSEKMVNKVLSIGGGVAYLDENLENEDYTLKDRLKDESLEGDVSEYVIDKENVCSVLENTRKRLNKRNVKVLELRLQEVSVSDIASRLGVAEITIFRSLTQIKEIIRCELVRGEVRDG